MKAGGPREGEWRGIGWTFRMIRFAPCSAAAAAASVVDTKDPTRLFAPDSSLRATPIGTPVVQSKTRKCTSR